MGNKHRISERTINNSSQTHCFRSMEGRGLNWLVVALKYQQPFTRIVNCAINNGLKPQTLSMHTHGRLLCWKGENSSSLRAALCSDEALRRRFTLPCTNPLVSISAGTLKVLWTVRSVLCTLLYMTIITTQSMTLRSLSWTKHDLSGSCYGMHFKGTVSIVPSGYMYHAGSLYIYI